MFADNPAFQKKMPYTKGKSKIHMISVGVNPVPPVGYGGIETVVANLSHSLVYRGHKVAVYSPGVCNVLGTMHYQTMEEPLTVYDNGQLVINPAQHIDSIIRGLIDNYRAGDIIHLHHQLLLPSLNSLGQTLANICETAHWKATGLSHNICYPSKASMADIKKPGELVYHGVDTDYWGNSISGANVRSSIVYVGRITPDKGVDVALDACEALGLTLHIAGPEPSSEDGWAQDIIKRAKYLGEKKPSELRDVYFSAKAMLYMTQYCEPFGLAVVEAMACGCPVIVSGKGATSETVEHGLSGYIVSNESDLPEYLGKVDDLNFAGCIKQSSKFSLTRQAEQQEAAYYKFFGTN